MMVFLNLCVVAILTVCWYRCSAAGVRAGPADLRPVRVEQDLLHPAALQVRHAGGLRGRHRRGGLQ